MSRTNDVNIAMQYAKSGVDGVHLMDSHKATIGWVVNTLAAEVERLEAHLKGSMQAGGYEHFVEQLRNAQRQAHNAIYVAQQLEKKVDELEALDELTTNQAKEYLARAEAAEARVNSLMHDNEEQRMKVREEITKRAETEARVAELEAQYACKRHHGEEALGAAAQLTDDMLQSCQICGLTVDLSKGHCEPTIEFTMQGRTDKKAKKLAELEAQNARLREALEFLLIGYEGLGGDMENNAPREAKAALADGKAAP